MDPTKFCITVTASSKRKRESLEEEGRKRTLIVQPFTSESAAIEENWDVARFVGSNRRPKEREKVYQVLKNVFQPGGDFSFPVKEYKEKGKMRKRYFNRQRLDEYPGLVYSPSQDGCFCLYCILFGPDGSRGILVDTPFQNWKKARDHFDNHFRNIRADKTKGARGYESHKAAEIKALSLIDIFEKKQDSVDVLLDKQRRVAIERNRKALGSIAETVVLCGRQSFALRGHRDDSQHLADPSLNKGNFHALLEYRMNGGDSNLVHHFENAHRNATYRSKTTQNTLIRLAGEQVLGTILQEVKKGSKLFSIQADELQDLSHREQLTLCIRYVTDKETISEDFVCLVDVTGDISGEHLRDVILQKIKDLGLDPADLRGQCYDGAGNMRGPVKGLGPRIEKDYPKAVYFWCASHQLNRAIVASCLQPLIRNMIGTTDEVVKFFDFSSGREKFLSDTIDEMASPERGGQKRKKLHQLCKTRWVERHAAYEVFVDLFPQIVTTLERMSTSGEHNRDTARDATSHLAAITRFEFIVSLVTVSNIMGYLKTLSTSLQGRQVNIVGGFNQVRLVHRTLQQIRSDTFEEKNREWFQQARELAEETYWATKDVKPGRILGALKACKRAHFPNIHRILEILCVFPVTSCKSERSFSHLRRLENYMRTTMTEERLNGLMMMQVHREIEVDLQKLVDQFAQEQPRRMLLANILSE